jgi:hypothetical protein
MHLKDTIFTKTTLFIFFAIFFIAGCGGRLATHNKDKVTQKNYMRMLQNGDQEGEWRTNELAIIYKYKMTPESLDISGTAELLGGLYSGFGLIDRLEVYLLFLDSQGVVMENVALSSFGRLATGSIPMVFESNLPIPEGARTITFAYEGVLKGVSSMSQTTYEMNFYPYKR